MTVPSLDIVALEPEKAVVKPFKLIFRTLKNLPPILGACSTSWSVIFHSWPLTLDDPVTVPMPMKETKVILSARYVHLGVGSERYSEKSEMLLVMWSVQPESNIRSCSHAI